MWPPSEFLIHTLLSLWVPSIAIWPSWPASVSHSLGVVHIRNFSVFLSNFAMALWYITKFDRKTEKFRMWTTDRKSTRLSFSHQIISYAVFCLKKKKRNQTVPSTLTRV